MRGFGGKGKLVLFLVLALFLGLQLSLLSLAPAGADDPPGEDNPEGWYEQYSNENGIISGVSATDAKTFVILPGDRLAAIDGDSAWLAPLTWSETVFASICKTSNQGITWFPQYGLIDFPYFTGMTAVDGDIAWSAGYHINPETEEMEDGFILHTTDGGWPEPAPQIISIESTSGYFGSEVTISGTDFGASQDTAVVAFGDIPVPATSMLSWSDTDIVCTVPEGLSTGQVMVTVTTPGGGPSNEVPFTVIQQLSVTSVSPTSARQFTFGPDLTIRGTGFQAGASVWLYNHNLVIYILDVGIISSTEIKCSLAFPLLLSGSYNIMVKNPDGGEASLEQCFTVTPLCGTGSGSTLLMLGLAMGLLSLAGTGGVLKRRRKIRKSS
jgi:hypothetical protein